MSSPELKGRTAVITGASRGIGAGLAESFAGHGMRLGLCSRSAPVLPGGDDVVSRIVDVRDEAGMQRFTDEVVERFGAIDLWINNAGVLAPIAPLRDIELEAFREHIDINLSGVFLGSRCYVRHVRSHEGPGSMHRARGGERRVARPRGRTRRGGYRHAGDDPFLLCGGFPLPGALSRTETRRRIQFDRIRRELHPRTGVRPRTTDRRSRYPRTQREGVATQHARVHHRSNGPPGARIVRRISAPRRRGRGAES
ncbi:MAG: SDR family NAD(P)-dependent oxidoreductase [Deltaproteobacteria bacterium]|nr:SDR family NAD(P)-dependent oxidoreductase [Deltaproteobacteria bacterium]